MTIKAHPDDNQYVVECSDWRSDPMTAEQAGAWAARVADTCHNEHHVVPFTGQPTGSLVIDKEEAS